MDKNDPLRQLWLAAVLLTRLPLPHLPKNAFEQGPRAVWAYPLVGLGVGAVGAMIGSLGLWLGMPAWSAAVLTLGSMILLTGAMHEDGLADLADGFWGGFTPARRLEIMRDSQIGTYGVLALVLVSIAKVSAVTVLLEAAPLAIVAAAALSRAVMPSLMHALPHARADGLSHSVGRPGFATAALAIAIGTVIGLLCAGLMAAALLALALGAGAAIGLLAKRKIGGQTGDVLGAAQQLSEAVLLLACTTLI